MCTAGSNCTGKSVTHFMWCRAGHSASGHMLVLKVREYSYFLHYHYHACTVPNHDLLCAALLCYSEHAATLLTSPGTVQDTFQAGKGSAEGEGILLHSTRHAQLQTVLHYCAIQNMLPRCNGLVICMFLFGCSLDLYSQDVVFFFMLTGMFSLTPLFYL